MTLASRDGPVYARRAVRLGTNAPGWMAALVLCAGCASVDSGGLDGMLGALGGAGGASGAADERTIAAGLKEALRVGT